MEELDQSKYYRQSYQNADKCDHYPNRSVAQWRPLQTHGVPTQAFLSPNDKQQKGRPREQDRFSKQDVLSGQRNPQDGKQRDHQRHREEGNQESHDGPAAYGGVRSYSSRGKILPLLLSTWQ